MLKTKLFNIFSNSILVMLLTSVFLSSTLYCDDYNKETDFSQIFSDSFKGDIAGTASPVFCADNGDGECDWDYQGYLFDIDPLVLNDGGNENFDSNSGKAKLILPSTIKGEDIVWARIYWQGHIFGLGNHNDFENAITDYQKIKILDFKGNEYALEADESDRFYYGYDEKDVTDTDETGYRFFYQASADVTSIVKNSYDSEHTIFTAGDIKATPTKDIYYIHDTKLDVNVKWGNWGGWSLVVAYKDSNTSTKNITFYDGFKFLLPQFGETESLTIDLPPDSFLTPTYGDVESKTIMFSAGAEKKIARDKLEIKDKNDTFETVYNTNNPEDNQMNDSITYLDSEINSTRIFNPGIDLDTYNTTDLLSNTQTTTSIRATMTAEDNAADQAFVGFIGISVKLYEPRVCYYVDKITDENNVAVYENKEFVSDVVQNKKYKVSIWIANMKKDTSDTNIETAKKVKVDMNYLNFDYSDESTFIRNIDSDNLLHITDATDDDIGEFLSDSNQSIWRVGTDATSTEGGTILPTEDFNDDTNKVFVDFNGTFVIEDNTTEINLDDIFIVKASYATDYLEIVNPVPIPKCQDFNTIGSTYIPAIGTFNIVNNDYSGGSVPLDINDSVNALYGQLAGQQFTVKTVSLDSDFVTPKDISTILKVDLIKNPYDESECQSNPSLYSTTVLFDKNESYTPVDIKYSKADRDLRFRIKYLVDSEGGVVDSNSIDACFKNTDTEYNDYACIWGILTGKIYDNSECNEGNDYPEDKCPCALECNPNDNDSPNHNEECVECVFGNQDMSDTVCSRDNFSIRPNRFEITNVPLNIKAGKDFKITIQALDINNTPSSDYNETLKIVSLLSPKIDFKDKKSSSGCITGTLSPIGSLNFKNGEANITLRYSEVGDLNLTIREITGSEFAKVDTKDTTTSRLIAQKSKILTILPDHFTVNASFKNSGTNFTYLSADINDTMAALLDINITAKNGLNAITKNYNSLCYSKKSDYNVTFAPLNISGLSKIIYQDKNSSTIGNTLMSNNSFTITNLSKDIFKTDNNGSANVKIKINFDRNESIAVNPFKFNIKDTNVSDEDNVSGYKLIDTNATFYYGRVHAPDYRGESPMIVTVFYEVYCKDCNKTDFNIVGAESMDSIYWYTNTQHSTLSLGSVNQNGANSYDSVAGTIIVPAQSNFINNGEETIGLNLPAGAKAPYKDKIKMHSSSWLLYNITNPTASTNDFLSEFYNANNKWSGRGHQGKTVDLNVSSVQNRRLDW